MSMHVQQDTQDTGKTCILLYPEVSCICILEVDTYPQEGD